MVQANASTTTRRKLDNACSLMFALGAVIFALFIAKRHFLPPNVPHIEFINTISIVTSTGLITASLFLSLYGVFTVNRRRWMYSWVAFVNGFFLLVMFSALYYQFLFITRAINKIESKPDLFPVLSEQISKVKNPEDAEMVASVAYKMYGVRMAYTNSKDSPVYYSPTQNDTKFRSDIEKMDSAVSNLRHVSLGLLYGMSDIALTVFTTFLAGLLWATFRRWEPAQPSNSDLDSQKI